jgi:hypothetical protein
MKAVVALVCSVTVLLAGCFPNNPARRRQAKYVEGAALIAGIGVSALANTGADCDQMDMMSTVHGDNSCRTTAQWLGTAGLLLIVGGLLGFVATIATAEDIEVKQEKKEALAHPVAKDQVKLPPGVTVKQPPSAPAPAPDAPPPTTPTPDTGSATPPPSS